jgi:hypothetical protein
VGCLGIVNMFSSGKCDYVAVIGVSVGIMISTDLSCH